MKHFVALLGLVSMATLLVRLDIAMQGGGDINVLLLRGGALSGDIGLPRLVWTCLFFMLNPLVFW